MAEFHQTGRGRAFFEGTLPKIATALQAIAQELKTANDKVRQAQTGKPVEVSPTRGVPKETSSSKESFSMIQRVAILAYKGGVFWGKVNSPNDLKEQNDSLLEAILQALSRELSSGTGDKVIDHMEKIARMRSALLDVFDFFERSHGVLPSWSEVVKALRLSESHSYSMEEQAHVTREYIYQRTVKIG